MLARNAFRSDEHAGLHHQLRQAEAAQKGRFAAGYWRR